MSETQTLQQSHVTQLVQPSGDSDVMEQVIDHLGGMGTYQRLLFLMMMPLGIIYSFVYSVQMFVAATPQQHWCKVPELMHLDIDLRRNLSIPGASLGPDWDRCTMFDANWTLVLANLTPPDPSTPTVSCQNGWEFLYNDIPYPTIISEQQSHVTQLVQPSGDSDVMEQVIDHLGGMGTYQRLLFLMMMPLGIIYSFVYSVQMFVAATPQQHWCKVPELMHLDIDLRRNLSIPGASLGPDWDRCTMFDANWTLVLANLTPPDPSTPTVSCQNGWEFLYNDIPYPTIISEREWVCDKSSYAPTAQALFFVGSLVGSGLFGWMGDKFGRVPSLMGANLIGCVGGVASAFTTGLWDFIICRFLVGMSNDCCFMMMYIIVLEYVGPKHRSWSGNLSFALFCGAGGAILPALALWLGDWRRLLVVTSLPMLVVLAAPWVVPESARWLATTGKLNRALKVLKKFERVNKTKIPEDILQKFISLSNKESETDESMFALLRSAPIRNCMICLIFVTVSCSIIIDAIIRMSETIGTNFFVTFALSSSVEVPALTLVAFILDKAGRRFLSFLTISMAGVLSLVCAFVPQGVPQLVFALMVRFSVNMSVGVLTQLTTELLPTGLRAMGSSIIHMVLLLATAFSPFVVYSGKLWRSLPLVILFVLGLLGGGVALLLPETKGQPMPQTIADGEKLVMQGRLCGKPKEEQEREEVIFLK